MIAWQAFALQMMLEGLIVLGADYKGRQAMLKMEMFKEAISNKEKDDQNLLKLAVFLAEQGALNEIKTEIIMCVKGGNMK